MKYIRNHKQREKFVIDMCSDILYKNLPNSISEVHIALFVGDLSLDMHRTFNVKKKNVIVDDKQTNEELAEVAAFFKEVCDSLTKASGNDVSFTFVCESNGVSLEFYTI